MFFKSIVTALAIAVAAPAIADTNSQMRGVEQLLADRGYTSNGFERHGMIGGNQTATHEVYVSQGRSYFAVSVCDTNCSDVDLEVIDQNGRVVGSDTEADDFPLVPFRASYTGTYYVRVKMYTCSSSRCNYRVATFGD